MCIVAVDAPCGSSKVCLSEPKKPTSLCLSGKEPNIKRSNPADERKEKSRDAARERRAKEFEYFQVQKKIYIVLKVIKLNLAGAGGGVAICGYVGRHSEGRS